MQAIELNRLESKNVRSSQCQTDGPTTSHNPIGAAASRLYDGQYEGTDLQKALPVIDFRFQDLLFFLGPARVKKAVGTIPVQKGSLTKEFQTTRKTPPSHMPNLKLQGEVQGFSLL